jgi:hypothetical protein
MYKVKWQFENEPCEREYETIAQAEAGVIENGMAYYFYVIYDADENIVEVIHNGIIFAPKDAKLQADNAAMRAALERYADERNWACSPKLAAEVLARIDGDKLHA